MKKVLIIGAPSIHISRLVHRLDKKKLEVDYLQLGAGNIDLPQETHQIGLFEKAEWSGMIGQVINYIKFVRLIKKTLALKKYDLLHVFWVGYHAHVACFFSKGIPIIVNPMGCDLFRFRKNFLFRLLSQQSLKKAHSILITSEHLKEPLMKMKIDMNKVRVILRGIDLNLFSPCRATQKQPTLLSVRSLEPIYDVETLIKAVPFILTKFQNAQFIIAGDGPQRMMLEQMVIDLKVEKNVTFVGEVSQQKTAELMSSAWLYVSTAKSDGISNAMLEAMACGTAILTTDFGDNPQWAKHEFSGDVFSISDEKMLADKAIKMLSNPEKLYEMGSNALDLVKKHADKNKLIMDIENYYNCVAENKGAH